MPGIYYERKLPHWHPPGATFFLTYRLHGSMPVQLIRELRETTEQELEAVQRICQDPALLPEEIRKLQKRYFALYDKALDANANEPHWLKIPEVAQEVFDSLLFIGQEEAEIHTFTIMPNHVHVLLTHRESQRPLYKLLQSHKGFTARRCNTVLGRNGTFWEEETYDHVVRQDGEFERIAEYILQNPVKAGLVKEWQDWRWTHVVPRTS